jgi:diguanylate cyclase (GGDEF)-like protein/PAS domain S-box-containing protein
MFATRTLRPMSIQRRTWLFVAFLCVALTTLDCVTLLGDRAAQLARVGADSANLTRSLADHAQSAFHLADALILEFRDLVESEGAGPPQRARLHALMAGRVGALSLLRFIFVTDETGKVIASSTDLPPGGIDISSRDYFRSLRASAGRGPVLGSLDRSRLDRTWSVRIARRIDRADGSFAGIVVGTFDLGFFQDYYRSFDVGKAGEILLMMRDGRLMAREPFVDASINTVPRAAPSIGAGLPRAPAGMLETPSGVAGARRMLSYRRVEDFPLLVAVTRSKRESLAPWRSEAWSHVAGLVAMVAVIGVFASGLTAQIRRRERSENERAALAAEHRLLAENATDLVCRLGADLTLLYVSPSARGLLGYEPEDLAGASPDCFTHPDDRAAVALWCRKLLDPAGPADSATCQYRGVRRDGSTLWLEAGGKRLAGCEGIVLTCRDISVRKAIETQLEELTRLDGLTGLVNRRGFDQRLDHAVRRASRVPSPVSLVMIDVDRFKMFNDTYGHQQGDACLRAVAGAIGAAARRATDVAARYGGEEFALLLEDTDLDGALHVAERVRNNIASLGLRHEGSANGIVTASLGVAASYGGGPEQAGLLVEHADAALYAAKRGGRNRVQAAEPPRSETWVRPPATLSNRRGQLPAELIAG